MRLLRALVLLVVFSCALASVPSAAHAQKEYDTWYFGFNTGLDFSTAPPTVLNDGKMETLEGSASISDPVTGDILFYTDGRTVWNRAHLVMPNGTGLFSDPSSTQAALIIPMPHDNSKYYIFTVDHSGYQPTPSQGICYSVVDMSRGNGYGDVIVKNRQLLQRSSEKLVGIKLCNGNAFWVIGHEMFTDRFFAWLVDANGVSAQPVISPVGTVHGPMAEEGIGWMSASPTGTKLALAFWLRPGKPSLELYRFDPATGVVSDPVFLTRPDQPYGVAFSPDGRKLYATSSATLDQFDLTNWDQTSIENTWYGFHLDENTNGAIKLGSDGKLYLQHSTWIGVVHAPDLAKDKCLYSPKSIFVGAPVQYGLPNNVDAHAASTFCGPPEAFIKSFPSSICREECMDFFDSSQNGVSKWEWTFEGATPGTAFNKNPKNICYATNGVYQIRLIVSNQDGSDTAYASITIGDCPPPEVGLRDTTICKGQCVLFVDTSTPNYTRTWTFESGTPSSFVGKTPPKVCYDKAGIFKVTLVAKNNFGADTAIADVTVEDCPRSIARSEYDSIVCAGDPVDFTDQSLNEPTSWDWLFAGGNPSTSTLQDPKGIKYDMPGEYIVRQIVRNKYGNDTAFTRIKVEECRGPIARIRDSITICQGECISLFDSSTNEPTVWSWLLPGADPETANVKDPLNICYKQSGTFTITLVIANAFGRDTAYGTVTVISAEGKVTPELIILTPIEVCATFDTSITLTAACAELTYQSASSDHSSIVISSTSGSVAANSVFQLPVTIAPDKLGQTKANIFVTLGGKDFTIPITYTAIADAEDFAYGEFDTEFSSTPCEEITRELPITNQSCAEQQIASATVVPNNSGFTLLNQSFPIPIESDGTASLLVHYDPAISQTTSAELIIITTDGTEKRFLLTGSRRIPKGGTIRLEALNSSAIEPNDVLAARILIAEEIDATRAPSEIELTLRYNTDLLTASSIETQGGWTVADKSEGANELRLLLARKRDAISAESPVLDLTFNSFVAADETTELLLSSVRCDPSDPTYEQCIYRLTAPDSARVAVLGLCGGDAMRDVLGRPRDIQLVINPHPVNAGAELRFEMNVADASLKGKQFSVEIIDMVGRRLPLFGGTLNSLSQDYDLPLRGASSGVYVLQITIGDRVVTRTLIVE
jgi:PKD repeat protein